MYFVDVLEGDRWIEKKTDLTDFFISRQRKQMFVDELVLSMKEYLNIVMRKKKYVVVFCISDLVASFQCLGKWCYCIAATKAFSLSKGSQTFE